MRLPGAHDQEGSCAVGVQLLEMVSEVIDGGSATHGRSLALGISVPDAVDQASGRVTLGAAIATVCAIVDPELIVLGGGVGANPLSLRRVRGATAAPLPIPARVETSILRDRAAVPGRHNA